MASRMSVEGSVPSTDMRDAIVQHLQAQLAPGQKLGPAIQVSADAADPDWLATLPTFFKRYLEEVNSPRIILGPDVVVLFGNAPSKIAADELANLVQAQLSGHTVANRLTYPDEAESP